MSTTTRQIDEERLREAALSRLASEEAEREEQEAQAEAQRKQAVRRQMDAEEDRADNIRVGQLAGLRPLYARRRQLSEQLTDVKYAGELTPGALAELGEVESQIREQENAIGYGIRPGTLVGKARQLIADIRFRAGLAPSHNIIGMPTPPFTRGQKIAYTALKAIVSGMISEGVVNAAGATTGLSVDEGI